MRRLAWLCLLPLLGGCVHHEERGLPVSIGHVEVRSSCSGKAHHATNQRVAKVLMQQLTLRLTRLNAYKPGRGEALDLCIKQVHLRPDLAVLFLYLFVDPNVLVVKVRLPDGEGRFEERVVSARSSAGGWPSSLGVSRRLEILVQVVTQKILKQLGHSGRQEST
ncbi:MAG: hypothetical protein D6703_04760 [Zetaproteobacteria bacterium]|nr:MAG: hypothetical protein D6703_04760 [Zetaproteobacteria bacterium]